jgi:hypothetical protein
MNIGASDLFCNVRDNILNVTVYYKIQNLIEIKKLYIIYLNLPGTFFFSIFFTFLFSQTVLQYRDIINKITNNFFISIEI